MWPFPFFSCCEAADLVVLGHKEVVRCRVIQCPGYNNNNTKDNSVDVHVPIRAVTADSLVVRRPVRLLVSVLFTCNTKKKPHRTAEEDARVVRQISTHTEGGRFITTIS
jgi:hypothetical protein